MATRRERRIARAKAVAYFAVDAVVLVLFVVAGRDTRESTAAATLAEAAPFLVGAGVGWLVARGWRAPRAVRWTGVVVWGAATAVGLALRVALGQPTDTRFVVITFVSLGLFLCGWRAIAWVLEALFGRAMPKVVDEKYRR